MIGESLKLYNLAKIIIDDVDFIGASCRIEIFEGMSQFKHIGKGNREVGTYDKLQNFHSSIWLETGLPLDISWYRVVDTMFFPAAELVFDASWISAYPPSAFATPPAIVKIGGLFSAFEEGWSMLDKENAEFLLMFLMAVGEINNKTDGVTDDLPLNWIHSIIIIISCPIDSLIKELELSHVHIHLHLLRA